MNLGKNTDPCQRHFEYQGRSLGKKGAAKSAVIRIDGENVNREVKPVNSARLRS